MDRFACRDSCTCRHWSYQAQFLNSLAYPSDCHYLGTDPGEDYLELIFYPSHFPLSDFFFLGATFYGVGSVSGIKDSKYCCMSRIFRFRRRCWNVVVGIKGWALGVTGLPWWEVVRAAHPLDRPFRN